ncbi:MAG: DUF433 domain-containing protein [Chloroflexota bacterium]|nr:MAG: DUF433 domain-containing protein [Chloroflexota bacterium]
MHTLAQCVKIRSWHMVSEDESILAFSPDQVCRLTSLSDRQLRYWDKTEFFSPEFRAQIQRSPQARVYSFRDVVGLRAIAELLKVHKVPLQQLRKVDARLDERYRDPWANLVFWVGGRRVLFEDEQRAISTPDGAGQKAMPFDLARIRGEVTRAIADMRRRRQHDVGTVERDRGVAENRPVLAGTRIPTRAIWEFYAAGYRSADIVEQYPSLTLIDVEAAIDFERSQPKKAS